MDAVKRTLRAGDQTYGYYSLREAQKGGLGNIGKLPKSLKVLLENLLRKGAPKEDIKAIDDWATTRRSNHEIYYHPSRVVLQDFTGVPAVVDLAAMRNAMNSRGKEPDKINPQIPVDLVIDHSIQVEHFGTAESFDQNVAIEYRRNAERYRFLKWGQTAFKNFRVVPPGTGIIHQVNLEYLAQVVRAEQVGGDAIAFPDTCVGTDSHTTMINGLSVLGWGVGGIEAEAAMLGQPISMLIPEVVGFKLTGRLAEGVTATDLVLYVVEALRTHGVVGKFVEFFGSGLNSLSLADRATLANMAPEYGATCGFFPIDGKTLDYLSFSGRDEQNVELVHRYAKEQGLWLDEDEPLFSSVLSLDIGEIATCISGPKRPQDKILLSQAKASFSEALEKTFTYPKGSLADIYPVEGMDISLNNGSVVVAAITSCTNTSNPSVLVAAGLVAKKAVEKGLQTKPWVKTSLAPGSKVVTDYLIASGLQQFLDVLGFHLVGYGCTTCIGNSGPLPEAISKTIHRHDICAVSVLSGNRNFEGRISPDVKANYLASPPLVVCYALAGTMDIDLAQEPLGCDSKGQDIFMKDIWPSNQEIEEIILEHISSSMYKDRYANVFEGDTNWNAVNTPTGRTYQWDEASTYIARPNFFDSFDGQSQDALHIDNAHVLALLGDSVTTDHISPAGTIKEGSPAGQWLVERGVGPEDFNSYGSRRGNHHIMTRGTFANIRLKNELIKEACEGGYTIHIPTGQKMTFYDAAVKYKEKNTDLIIIAGKEYGTGSSRDWAAKGTRLLGVKAVLAESFERIHRSNLIGMGVMPLQFLQGESRKTLELQGDESISLKPMEPLDTKMQFELTIKRKDGTTTKTKAISRCDTQEEIAYFKSGGILQYVLKTLE